MVKIGKDKLDIDPFAAGNKAFGALDDVLDALGGDAESAAPASKPERADNAPKTPSKQASSNKPVRRKKVEAASQEVGESKSTSAQSDVSMGVKRPRRFLSTDEEMASWQRAAMRLGASTGARIDFSKMTRALWEIYLRHEDDVIRNVPDGAHWKRPSNADTVGLAELDEQLADLLNEGLMVASRRPRNVRRSEE